MRGTNPPMGSPTDGSMADTDDVLWLTYDALAARLGIGSESCRNLVRRRRWARQDGNDGLRRIGVPREYLSERDEVSSPTRAPTDVEGDPPTDVATALPSDGGVALALTALERHIRRVEDDLDQARGQIEVLTSERDEARAALGQVEVLRAQLDAGHARIQAAEADRDRWYAEAQQDRATRLSDAERAHAEADAVRVELAAWKARPWWRRAFG